ncbi:MAG: DUF3568 domain-containing protein [Syntrophales bacterium]|nr:DUF3568 domain-containing protein [Syntrophales bacterium]
MKRIIYLSIFVGIYIVFVACEGGIVLGSKSVSFQSGKFVYGEGYVVNIYRYPFEMVWSAVEELVKEMNFSNVEREKKIGVGQITGVLHDEKAVFKVVYTDRDLTEVSVLVGLGGNNVAARFLHERIAGKLRKGLFSD